MMCVYLFEQWSDFYSGQPTQTYGSRTSQLRITSSGNVYVSNALFNKITTSGYGGAIYCSSVTILFLSESCSFINITASGQGGAIYLYITGESILSKVCGYGCSTSGSDCHFDYIEVTNNATKRNFLSYVSVCHLIHTGSVGINVNSKRGNIKYSSLNSSQNECGRFPGFSSEYQGGDDCCIIEYCSVTNCTSKFYGCIKLFTTYSKKVRFCNILYNRHLDISSSNGVIHSDGVVTIENSCILGNIANYQASGVSGSTISNCTIDFNSSVVSGVSITNTPKESFVVKISCFSTALCEAFYDSYKGITDAPIKIIIIMTCKCNSYLWDANFIANLIVLISFLSS
jgi:predicted outer membrane repeat protein